MGSQCSSPVDPGDRLANATTRFLYDLKLDPSAKSARKKARKHGPFIFDVVIYKAKVKPVLDATPLRAQIHCMLAALSMTGQHR